MKHNLPSVVASVTVWLALFSTTAQAQKIVETISISGGMGVGGTVATSNFPAFDPSLGTLVSMAVHSSGTLDYTGKGIPADEGACLELEDESFPGFYANLANVFLPKLGSGLPYAFNNAKITKAKVLADYTGTGTRFLVVYDCGGNLTDHIQMTGSGTVTYFYIPPPPTAPVPWWLGAIARLSVTVAGPITPPPGTPVEASIGFADLNGNLIGQASTVTLIAGQVQSVDLNTNLVVPVNGHADVRPQISTVPGAYLPPLLATTEIFESATGFGRVLTTTSTGGVQFGPQGLAGGQVMRVIASAFPPDPCSATLSFSDRMGNPVGPSLTVNLKPGLSDPLNLDANVLGLQTGQRTEVQPIVTLANTAGVACAVSSEVINKGNGQAGTYQQIFVGR
jgi:hypothetical protein